MNGPARDSLAELMVVEALATSYPGWTDEHGTNIEQLAEIAVQTLGDHGLLARPVDAPPSVVV